MTVIITCGGMEHVPGTNPTLADLAQPKGVKAQAAKNIAGEMMESVKEGLKPKKFSKEGIGGFE